MTKTHTKPRKRIALVGRLAIVVGAMVALTAGSMSPASAQQSDENKITICHRTNSPDNPYRVVTVSFDAGNGELQGPDHTGHPGPAFDFGAQPEDADYPYTSPRNGDQWGDIIPSYSWDGGSYPGMNWDTDGQAIYDADEDGTPDCGAPIDEEEPPSECPSGTTWEDANSNQQIDEGECQPPAETCPAGTTWVDAGVLNGEIDEGECVAPQVVTCPVGQTHADANANGIVDDGECQTPQVINTVVEQTPVAPVTEVLGVQVAAAELPRTGKASLPLAELGLGLLLMGAGALIFARDEAATA